MKEFTWQYQAGEFYNWADLGQGDVYSPFWLQQELQDVTEENQWLYEAVWRRMAVCSCFFAVSFIQIFNIYQGELGELGLSYYALLYPGKTKTTKTSFPFKRSYGRMIWSLFLKWNSSFGLMLTLAYGCNRLDFCGYTLFRYLQLDLQKFKISSVLGFVSGLWIGKCVLDTCAYKLYLASIINPGKLCSCSYCWLRKHTLLDSFQQNIRKSSLNISCNF